MELQDIVRRVRRKQSIKAIKRETAKDRRAIPKVLELAEQEGWLDTKLKLPSEPQLQEVYHEQRAGEDSHQIEAWRQEGYSFPVIHELSRRSLSRWRCCRIAGWHTPRLRCGATSTGTPVTGATSDAP